MIRSDASAQRAVTLLLIALCALCLAGCAGTAKRVSPSRLQAINHNQRGIDEQARGRMEIALAQFNEALRLHSSIENTDGMLVALINIARTRRVTGDLPSARQAIERACSLLPEPSELASELFFEKAKILLAAGDLAGAGEWAVRAEAAEKGADLGRRVNLVGAILLRQGMPDEAQRQLERALKLNRGAGLAGEEANSLRLLGEIHLARGSDDSALACYQGALVLDKELGFGKKIAADLRGIGAVSMKKSDLPGAIGFYRRALEVSLNSGDASLAADDMARLAQLYRQNGDALSAQQFDDQRKQLVEKR